MSNYTLEQIETHFKQQQQVYGNLADKTSFDMIFGLIKQNRELIENGSRLTALNRHYLFRFFDGDVLKMQREFSYIKE